MRPAVMASEVAAMYPVMPRYAPGDAGELVG
jgi:hypothetical protein